MSRLHFLCTQFARVYKSESVWRVQAYSSNWKGEALRCGLLPLLDCFSWVWLIQNCASRECALVHEQKSPNHNELWVLVIQKSSRCCPRDIQGLPVDGGGRKGVLLRPSEPFWQGSLIDNVISRKLYVWNGKGLKWKTASATLTTPLIRIRIKLWQLTCTFYFAI